VAVGLYELFISKIDFPVGVTVSSLDDLKDKLLGVIVVALAVTFLSQITTWDGKTDLLSYGVSIALVVLALGAFSFFRRDKIGAAKDETTPQTPDTRES
jgi:uncharacterized membrane protein YqhA